MLAASERDGLLHAPDCYMERIVAGPACRGVLDLDAPPRENLGAIAKVLDRPRHEALIEANRAAGARIRLIGDGDLSAGIAAAVRGAGVHAVMGTGGAQEGVITAAAMRCLQGEMVGRRVVDTPELEARVERMGIRDRRRVYRAEDLAPGTHIIFAACGATEGALLHGVRFFGDGCRTHSIMMTLASNKVRFVDSIHMGKKPGPRGVRLY